MNWSHESELPLLACFGVEPRLLDPRTPWFYNAAVYEVEVDTVSVSFTIEPACGEVRIVVRRRGQRVFELNAKLVSDVRVIDEPGVDAVEIDMTAGSWLRMQLRPTFEITQAFDDRY